MKKINKSLCSYFSSPNSLLENEEGKSWAFKRIFMRGAIHWFFFVHLPWNHKKNHIQNHKITRKITYRKHQKSQITEKLLKNHTKKSLEITKITKNHTEKIMWFQNHKNHVRYFEEWFAPRFYGYLKLPKCLKTADFFLLLRFFNTALLAWKEMRSTVNTENVQGTLYLKSRAVSWEISFWNKLCTDFVNQLRFVYTRVKLHDQFLEK